MRIRSCQEMLQEYNISDLESDDKEKREELLSMNNYSIIIEGEHSEFDNLEKWIQKNLDKDSVKDLYYGKTGYDFGFREIFFCEKSYETILTKIIPNIYTSYPNGSISKSMGYDLSLEYEPTNNDAIVFLRDKNFD